MIWTWPMEEVQREKQRVRDYGISPDGQFKIPGMSTSYKQQALRELAKRLVLQEKYKDQQAEINRLIDRVEELETELEILRSKNG